jgi:hypothetical protein
MRRRDPEDWPEIKRLDDEARLHYANADLDALREVTCPTWEG